METAAIKLAASVTGRDLEDMKVLHQSDKTNPDSALKGDPYVMATKFLLGAVLDGVTGFGIKTGGRILGVSGSPGPSKPRVEIDKGPSLPVIPGRVKSRVNLKNSGMDHLISRHLSGKSNASQFSISEKEIRTLLQSKTVINTPITRIVESKQGDRYVREVNVGREIGADKFNDGKGTSIMTVMTDKFGNLVTAFPGVLE
jgi:hypothetical protein